jgi:endogenous inhibitor of DNA gyrase (YacG/DUF329 family)
MHSFTPSTPGTLLCPICRRPLRWAPDRWMATFECDRCGQFSDFASAALSSRKAAAALAGRASAHDARRKP